MRTRFSMEGSSLRVYRYSLFLSGAWPQHGRLLVGQYNSFLCAAMFTDAQYQDLHRELTEFLSCCISNSHSLGALVLCPSEKREGRIFSFCSE